MTDGYVLISQFCKNYYLEFVILIFLLLLQCKIKIRDLVGSLTRPVRELKGFQRVSIPAGESRTVTFEITEEELAYWHLADGITLGADGAYAFSAEKGDFHVWIAPNSAEGEPAKFALR